MTTLHLSSVWVGHMYGYLQEAALQKRGSEDQGRGRRKWWKGVMCNGGKTREQTARALVSVTCCYTETM